MRSYTLRLNKLDKTQRSEQDQQDGHFFLKKNIIAIKLSSTCFEQIIVHRQEVCTSNLQYFTMHHMRSLIADTIRLLLALGSGNVALYSNNNKNKIK
jgi:hypothetical protein